MPPLSDHEVLFYKRPRWFGLVIILAIAGLTCSLATRTFRLTVPHRTTVQSGDAQAMRQHMDRDAARWIPPVTVSVVLDVPTFYPHVAPAGPPMPGLLLDEPLYNRPPPGRS